MTLDTPAAVTQAFAHFVRTRDVEGLLSLYEPEALFVPEPEVRLTGHSQLREAFVGLLAIEPTLALDTTEVLEAAGLAFVSNAWTLRGVAPDRTPIERAGRSAVVMRRGGDGTFRIVVDRL